MKMFTPYNNLAHLITSANFLLNFFLFKSLMKIFTHSVTTDAQTRSLKFNSNVISSIK